MKKIILKSLYILIGLGALGALSGAGVIVYFSYDLPKISTLADYKPPVPSQILSRDGEVLAELGKEKRYVASFDEIPKVVVDAFLSAEDDAFYEHRGVDYMGVLRALIVNIKAGRVVQGGSTITQQVAKSLLLTHERSLTRKIKDFLLAQRIEKKFSKEEILYLYLNQVYLGGGYYGVKAAFEGYFGKSLTEATVAESAMLAGLLVAPGKYSPYVNPQYAVKRQHYVLGRMRATGKISEEEYTAALNEKIKFRLRDHSGFKAGYFTDWVRQRVIDLVGEDKFLTGGFTVKTTLDYELQKVAEEAVLEGARDIDKRQGYKGAIKKLESDEAIEEFEKKFRDHQYSETSQYFTISDQMEKEYELAFDEEEYLALREHQEIFKTGIKARSVAPGYLVNDRLLEALKVGEMYEGVVLEVNDEARVIFVSLGGATGIIPYEYFRWAHERNITEERHWWSYLTRPSEMIKRGDVVLVKVRAREASFWDKVTDNYKSKYKTLRKNELLQKEKYLLLSLEQNPEAQGALVSLSPQTGEILAFVGGNDFNESQFNRAIQSRRQPGSSFKPILFAAALENGKTPSSIILDAPEALGGVDESLNWKPRNYDGKFKGPITLRNALEQSRNIPTIKLADELGVAKILEFKDRIGFDAELDEDLSLALGSFGVTLMDIVATYALFPNGGKLIDPKSILSITDREGNLYELHENDRSEKLRAREQELASQREQLAEQEQVKEEVEKNPAQVETAEEEKINPYHVSLGGNQVYDPRLAYIMTNLLKGVVQNGTGRRAKDLSPFLGGKTGTTNNYVDAWFLGFSSNLVTGVWTGFDDNKTLGWGETGSKSALPIWKDFMEVGLKKFGEHDFQAPLGIVNVLIDKETGELAKPNTRDPFTEAFVEGTEPGAEGLQTGAGKDSESTGGDIFEDEDFYNDQ